MIIEKDREIAEELKKRFLASDGKRIRRLILYGSRAQGSATEESDFDFLVIEKDPAEMGSGKPFCYFVVSRIGQ